MNVSSSRLAVLLAGLLLVANTPARAGDRTFAVKGTDFLLDGKPFQIRSGELHYPRIPREYWKDRLQKARSMGLNTVCTYLFWNVHEPSPGVFDFTGEKDVASFVRAAGEAGLLVIVRPGPYVCSEWDFGGLPSWLLKDRSVKVRCMDSVYMRAAARYLLRVGRELAPLQISRGGPLIMVQVENEYGSYGNDRAYLRSVDSLLRQGGFDVPLFTSDGPAPHLLEAGTLPGVTPVVNFGGGPEKAFAELARFRTGIPHMCGEYWCGWFTHWGDSSWGGSSTEDVVRDVRWMAENGKSFNLYMFHGGTNFGWSAGANFGDAYEPDVTSYDYDAPLDEAGTPTGKYAALRQVLLPSPGALAKLPDVPAPLPTVEIPEITGWTQARMLADLPPGVRSAQPLCMEEIGQDHGFILYRTVLHGPRSGQLTVTDLHDYGLVFLDGRLVGTLDRRKKQNSLQLQAASAEPVLEILVEAMGRVNFGQRLLDRKGITERVTLRGVTLMDWTMTPLPMDPSGHGPRVWGAVDSTAGPKLFRASFRLAETGDCFLDMGAWSKGVVWVNGRNLGRFWDAGPQRSLYLPAPWLRKGRNEIVVLDLHRISPASLRGHRNRQEKP